MRDVFKKMSLKKIKSNIIPAKKKSHLVWVVSNDAYFKKLLIEGIPADQAKTTKVEAAEIDSAVLNSSKTDVLVIDLDGLPMKQWLSILKILNMKKQRPVVVLCFSHDLIEPAGTELLDKLDSSSGFFVFTKPISISEFFHKIFP